METYVYNGPRPAKVHAVRDCDGLENCAPQRIQVAQWGSWLDVLACETVRPCRRCALETALLEAFKKKDDYQGDAVGVCIASQGNPYEPSFSGTCNFTNTECTASGRERLERLSEAYNLRLYETCVGPVAWVVAPSGFAKMVARNLRTTVKDAVAPDELHMELVWRFLSRNGWEAFAMVDVWQLAAGALGEPA